MKNTNKPIIPQPKQEVEKGKEIIESVSIGDETVNIVTYEPMYSEPKQETIEEVAEIILANNIDGLKDLLNDDDLFEFYKGVVINYGVAIAKHQSEKMFTQIELEYILYSFKNYLGFGEEVDEKSWLTQHKKH